MTLINDIVGEIGKLKSSKAESNLVAYHYLEINKKLECLEDSISKLREEFEVYLNYQLTDIRKEIDNNFNNLVNKQEIMLEKLQRKLLTLDDAISLENLKVKEESGVHLTQLVVLTTRIDKLEEINLQQIEENTLNARRLSAIEHDLGNYREYRTAIEDLETDVMYLKESSRKIPHKCPACNGGGKEAHPLTFVGITTCECRACEGKGIVWG